MSTSKTVIIGLGNPLMGDDGTGLAALARLRDEWRLPAGVELVDGGTWGMNLLPVIEDAKRVLLLDAITANQPPGTVLAIERSRIPRYLATKISPHQVDLRDVLALAELRRTLPDLTMALGIEPERVELGCRLSPVVEDRLEDLVQAAVSQLRVWGHVCERVTEPVHA